MIELYNEDCLKTMSKIKDGSVDLILQDPPYGTTANDWDKLPDLNIMWREWNRIIKPNGAIILFGSQPFTSVLVTSNLSMFKYEWIWKKSHATGHLNSKKQPMRQHENICVFYEKQCAYNPQMIKKNLSQVKKLSPENQRELGKLFFDFKNKLDDLS